MLNRLDKTRQELAGKNAAIDAWLNARQDLLIQYVSLISQRNGRQKCLPPCTDVRNFCQFLVDYISAGHFEIYQCVVDAMEQASGRSLSLVNRIVPKLEHNTTELMQFIDAFCEVQDAELLMTLDAELNQLGPLLEERFRLEDRLVKALRLLDELLPAA